MIDTQQFRDEQRALAREVTKVGEQSWKADSADQALAWLRHHLYWPATVAATVSTEEGPAVRMQQRVFFRGHGDAAWAPVPSLLRIEGDAFQQARLASALAAAIVDVEFRTLWSADGTQAWPPLGDDIGYAAIQHYGIPTALLDWTANPSVAVHFATCSQSSMTSSTAAVLWLSAGDASELGLKFVLPPAYVSRLYRQRGLFTEVTPSLVDCLDGRCGRITFPAQPRCPALITNDGERTIEADLLPAEPWFDALKVWAWDNALDRSISRNAVLASMAFTAQHGHHPAVRDFSDIAALFSGADHLTPIMSYVFELAGRATRTGHCYDPRVLSLLERDNSKFFSWLRAQGERLPRCDQAAQPALAADGAARRR